MRRPLRPRIAWPAATPALAVVVSLAACASDSRPNPTEREASPSPSDTVVRIAEASRQFLVVEAVTSGRSGDAIRVPARLEFRDSAVAALTAPFGGRVVAVHVQTGDAARAGDPLVTLDCPEAASVRAAVASAAAALAEARAAVERQRRMAEEGVGIERERLEAEARVATLEAEATRAQAAAAFAGPGSGTTVVVRAPVAGTVIERKATEGLSVPQAGDPLVQIGNRAALWVVADVFERDIARVSPGARAAVSLPSTDGPLEGTVASIGTLVSGDARTAPVRIALARTPGTLRPGMYGRAEISVPDGDPRPLLPAEAVLIKGRDTMVFVETTTTTFERRPVTVSVAADGHVRVLSGLHDGDRVVIHGALLLDGAAEQLL